ncbi:transposable element Tc1 transposase [Trichonephila clavipes]|uniref:Transposable element Tc1 transposase n=1 Tax=Trichonephila clavipes TaxID=2585209 RepID=A0A8X6S4M0_TRICX|nr:transposable element Tc1 transposase [Trichonephila clavipes]
MRERHLLHMAVKDRTATSRLLATRSTATGVLMPASSIRRRLLQRGLRARCLYTGLPSWQTIDDCVWFRQWAHEHRAWQVDWHQVVISDESRFNLWDHDGRIRVRRFTGERCLLECVIE